MENIKTLIQENKDLIIVRPLKILRFQMEYRILIIFHFRAVIHCKALRFLLV